MPTCLSTRRARQWAALALAVAGTAASLPAQQATRGWFTLRVPDRGDRLEILLVKERDGAASRAGIALKPRPGDLRGLPLDQLSSEATRDVRFALVREAGTIGFEGTAERSEGRGTYTFVPNPVFVAALGPRGFRRPTSDELLRLAAADVTLDLINGLEWLGYSRTTLRDLARFGEREIGLGYARAMADAGLHLQRLDRLIDLRDHGVTPEYVADMRRAGYDDLGAADLINLKDHGVDPQFIAQLAAAGFSTVSVEDAIRAREHGVNAAFAQEFRREGFLSLTLGELIRLRDHGVSAEFARELRARSGTMPSAEQLVRAWVREEG